MADESNKIGGAYIEVGAKISPTFSQDVAKGTTAPLKQAEEQAKRTGNAIGAAMGRFSRSVGSSGQMGGPTGASPYSGMARGYIPDPVANASRSIWSRFAGAAAAGSSFIPGSAGLTAATGVFEGAGLSGTAATVAGGIAAAAIGVDNFFRGRSVIRAGIAESGRLANQSAFDFRSGINNRFRFSVPGHEEEFGVQEAYRQRGLDIEAQDSAGLFRVEQARRGASGLSGAFIRGVKFLTGQQTDLDIADEFEAEYEGRHSAGAAALKASMIKRARKRDRFNTTSANIDNVFGQLSATNLGSGGDIGRVIGELQRVNANIQRIPR